MKKIKLYFIITTTLIINSLAFAQTVPDSPTNVTATAANQEATISFDASPYNGGSEITSYTVTSTVGNFTATGIGSPIKVAGLTNGEIYKFIVTAKNAVGESESSIVSRSNDVRPCFENFVDVTSNQVCNVGSITFNIAIGRVQTPNLEVWNWYDENNTKVGEGESFTTPLLNQTTNYSVSLTSYGCETSKKPVTAVVNYTPAKPYIAQQDAKCDSGSFLLHAEIPAGRKADCRNCGDNNTYEWRDINRNIVFNDADFQTPMLHEYTTYLVTATLNGCTSDTSFIGLSIYQTPMISVTEPSAVCDSGSFVLSANRLVRKNCRGNCDPNNYKWRDPYNNNNIVSYEADFTTPMLYNNTVYTVTATYGECTSSPLEVNINVIRLSTPQGVDSSRCGPGQVTLKVNNTLRINTPNTIQYNWYDGAGKDANQVHSGESYIINDLTEDKSFYVESSQLGCSSERAKVNAIVINSVPVFTMEPISHTICEGDSINIVSKAIGKNVQYYLFVYIGDQALGGGEIDSVFTFAPSVDFNLFTLKNFAYNTCGIDTSDIYTIHVNFIDTSLNVNANTLTSNQTDATYQWINADTKATIDNAINASFTPTESGNYAVIITTNDCNVADTSSAKYVDLTTTTIENSSEISFSIYPNPASDIVNINLTENISGTVSITDINGNVVTNKAVSGSLLNISTSELSSGVYVLKIASETLTVTKQLVIVK